MQQTYKRVWPTMITSNPPGWLLLQSHQEYFDVGDPAVNNLALMPHSYIATSSTYSNKNELIAIAIQERIINYHCKI